MSNTRDEIMMEFFSILSEAAESAHEYQAPGESEWAPSQSPGESEWTPEGSGEWPKKVTNPDGTTTIYNNHKEWAEDARKRFGLPSKREYPAPEGSEESLPEGKKSMEEWYKDTFPLPDEEQDFPDPDEEADEANRIEFGTLEELREEEEPEVEVEVEEPLEKETWESDEPKDEGKIMEMIEKDPMSVVSRMMLQRKPEYQTAEFLLPLARSLLKEVNDFPQLIEKGSLLNDELKFILDLLSKINSAEKKESKVKYLLSKRAY